MSGTRHNAFLTASLVTTMLFTTTWALAQEPRHGDDQWEEWQQEAAEEALANESDVDALEALMMDIDDLREHPINLNAATKAELLRLSFLNEVQVNAIMDFVARYGPLHSVAELLLADGIGQEELRWLRAFTIVDDSDRRQLEQGKADKPLRQEFTTRLDIPFYRRSGWSWARGIAHRFRYVARWNKWETGIRGEKDAGEPMFTRDIPLWDALGAYACLRDAGPLVIAIAGDYKVSFGEGLVINQTFGFGKMQTNIWRSALGITPHRSTDEIHFMRGGAAVFDLGRGIQLTAFGSARRMDAVINADSTTNGISTSGLHRTESELSHRNAIWSHSAGIHAGWANRRYSVGMTAMWQHYNRPLVRGKALYRQIYPEGSHFGNVSIDYSARWGYFIVRGETARSFSQGGGGWATINRASLRLNPNTQLSAIQRFYSYRYYSPHARVFGESTNAQNESGICLAIDADRLGPFALRAYIDVFHSPWPRYTMTHASTGWELLAQTTYSPNDRHAVTVRYRMKNKERSDIRATDHTLRATYTWHIATLWTLRTSAFIHRHHTASANSTGYGFNPRIDYGDTTMPLAASLSAMLFRTTDYDSRLALYEPTLTQTFGLIQLYGRGQRIAATLRLRLGTNVSLQTKLGVTHYSDRNEISSGPTLIASPWKADASILLRLLLKQHHKQRQQ